MEGMQPPLCLAFLTLDAASQKLLLFFVQHPNGALDSALQMPKGIYFRVTRVRVER